MTGNRFLRFIGNLYRRNRFIDFHLRRIRGFTLNEIIRDPLANMTFKKYLRKKYAYGTRIIQLFWESYNLCNRVQLRTIDLNELIMNKLKNACPPYTEEGQLLIHLETYRLQNDEEQINNTLNQVKQVIIERMEDCHAFKLFAHDVGKGRKNVKQCIGEIFDILEDVKNELDDLLITLMGNLSES